MWKTSKKKTEWFSYFRFAISVNVQSKGKRVIILAKKYVFRMLCHLFFHYKCIQLKRIPLMLLVEAYFVAIKTPAELSTHGNIGFFHVTYTYSSCCAMSFPAVFFFVWLDLICTYAASQNRRLFYIIEKKKTLLLYCVALQHCIYINSYIELYGSVKQSVNITLFAWARMLIWNEFYSIFIHTWVNSKLWFIHSEWIPILLAQRIFECNILTIHLTTKKCDILGKKKLCSMEQDGSRCSEMRHFNQSSLILMNENKHENPWNIQTMSQKIVNSAIFKFNNEISNSPED